MPLFIAPRNCFGLYYHFMDSRLGLRHMKLWLPMLLQLYVNGHERLARKLTDNGIGCSKFGHLFVHLDDIHKARGFAGCSCVAGLAEAPRVLRS